MINVCTCRGVKYLKGLLIVQKTERTEERVLVEFHLISSLSQTGVVEALAEGTESSAGEQDDSLQLLVEEEIVETPDGAVLSERVGGQVRVVGEDVAAQEVDLRVESVPQLVVYLAVLAGGGDTQQIVDVVGHELATIKIFYSNTTLYLSLSPEDSVL